MCCHFFFREPPRRRQQSVNERAEWPLQPEGLVCFCSDIIKIALTAIEPFFSSVTAKAMLFPSEQKQIVKVRSGLEVNMARCGLKSNCQFVRVLLFRQKVLFPL